MELLPTWDDRLDWVREVGPLRSSEVLRGSIETDFAAVLAASSSRPAVSDLRRLWKERSQGAASPILVVAGYLADGAHVFAVLGPHEDDMPVFDAEVSRVEQVLTDALASTSPLGLVRDLRSRLQTFISGVAAGLRNEGLFATHVLEQQATERSDWAQLTAKATSVRSLRGQALLEGLGFQVETVADGAVLREAAKGHRRAAAVLLRDGETFDNPLNRLNNATAVAHGLLLAEREGLQWLVVLGGPVVRLYPVDPDVGVGRKGQTQTFVELDLALLSQEQIGFLALLISPESFSPDGFIADLLSKSSDFAADLATRLRDRIYGDVIEPLSVAVANKMRVADAPAAEQRAQLDEAYHRSMIILFRLLFVAYAEDRRLLPYGVSERYTRNALKTLAKDLVSRHTGDFDSNATTLWDDLTQVWKVIDGGDLHDWGVPAYNGGLFTRDAQKNPSGAAVYGLDLTNDVVGPVLRSLLVDETADGVPGPVDFRSLSVREFGTIYEGLLESGLDIATTDLALDADENFVPATGDQAVVWAAGQVYFHSKSGSRKSTGSYFTKPFAVEHLLDSALEPAIDRHLERIEQSLNAGRNKEAARNFFDFRVADLSMGSAHFLVAAIDRIEARFSRFLVETPIPEVTEELGRLRQMAASQLGEAADVSGIDDGVLLRRQIARRCIYGIDINEIAVELARLAVWIHTFVPGLPLSFLNHGLVWGNSLTGVGTIDEVVQAIADAEVRETKSKPNQVAIGLQEPLQELLDRAAEQLATLAELSDASVSDVASAAALHASISEQLAPLNAICDLITAERTTRSMKAKEPGKILLVTGASNNLTAALSGDDLERVILRHPHLGTAQRIAREVQAAHLPTLFPEVFRRDRPGFDVILGNPPWEKMKVEEHSWWALRHPGLRSVSQLDKNETIARLRSDRLDLVAAFEQDVRVAKSTAEILVAGPFPGIGATDIDLFSAFCWRFWHEVRDGGSIGVVLPRTAVSGAATAAWRNTVLSSGSIPDLTTLTNTARWAFDMEPRYTIALLTVTKGSSQHTVGLRGPFASMKDYRAGMASPGASAVVEASTVLSWSDTASIPLLPATELDVFAVMKQHPQMSAQAGNWRFRPMRELDTTKEKRFYDFDIQHPAQTHTLPVWTGGTFNLWAPGSGDPYAYADPSEIETFLQEKRANQIKLTSSAFYGLGEEWATDPATLPMCQPRIAFRDVCRATDSRTMICALVPPHVALVHKSPYLVCLEGSARDEAYLLGVLSSIPFDWFARRFVELAMTFELLNSFPVPRVDSTTGHALDLHGNPQRDGSDLRAIRDRVTEISARLAAVDARYTDWAAEVGVAVGSVLSQEAREDQIAELDALVSLLYGLTKSQVEQVFASFHRGWDYKPRLAAVLSHFAAWSERVAS